MEIESKQRLVLKDLDCKVYIEPNHYTNKIELSGDCLKDNNLKIEEGRRSLTISSKVIENDNKTRIAGFGGTSINIGKQSGGGIINVGAINGKVDIGNLGNININFQDTDNNDISRESNKSLLKILVPYDSIKELVINMTGPCEIMCIGEDSHLMIGGLSDVKVTAIKTLEIETSGSSNVVVDSVSNLDAYTCDSSDLVINNRYYEYIMPKVKVETRNSSNFNLETGEIKEITIDSNNSSDIKITTEYVEKLKLQSRNSSDIEITSEQIVYLEANSFNSSVVNIGAKIEEKIITVSNSSEVKIH